MPDFTTPSFADSACFAALRGAILAEQQVLELDSHNVSARVQYLLKESLRHLEPVCVPIVTISSTHQPVQPRAARALPLRDVSELHVLTQTKRSAFAQR